MQELSVRTSDAAAVSVLRHLSQSGATISSEISVWVTRVRERQGGGDRLTILEHTALAYLMRCGVLDRGRDLAPLRHEARAALADSWLHLTRKPLAGC